ncbi:MAG: glycosyltransferase [Flavobacteriales bacterium]|nr:glycosyltransferase [Flavobacteriales bacterium]
MREFTIITPVLNGAAQISDCILSVAQQGVDVQHIVMDGGSADGTQDIIAQHAHLISYWESKADEGQSHAINKGLAMADGRIMNWLNADDTLCPDALLKVAERMDDATDVVAGRCAHVHLTGETVTVGGTLLFPTLERTLGRYSMGQPSHFYRTSVVKDLGGLNPALHYAMDLELWFRYLLRYGQGRVRIADDVLSRFLLRDDSKSQRMAKEMEAEKYGIFHSLLLGQDMPAPLQSWLGGFPIPGNVRFGPEWPVQWQQVLAHFACPLLPRAYAQKDAALLRALLRTVNGAELLSATDRFLWELRLLKIRMNG